MTNFKTKLTSAFLAASIVLIPATPAFAHHQDYDDQYGYDQGGYYQNQGYDQRGYDQRGYDRSRYDDRRYYDRSNRYYRNDRCNKGTGGLIIGAIAGGLLGRAVVGHRGDRTAGTIIGAGAGALAGRAIDRSDSRRC